MNIDPEFKKAAMEIDEQLCVFLADLVSKKSAQPTRKAFKWSRYGEEGKTPAC